MTAASWVQRSRAGLTQRGRRVRRSGLIAAQAGLASGLAWFIAHDLLAEARPFFAPIAAVVVLGGTYGQRLTRAFELVLGVTVGIGLGDALITVIGVGAVQIAAVVMLAIVAMVFFGGGNVAVGQAASSAVLVATLAPPSGGIYFSRAIDAAIGGACGVLVLALLLPFNPMTVVNRAADAAVGVLIDGLTETSTALTRRDPQLAEQALGRLRAGEATHAALRESLQLGRETAALAPARWSARTAIARYAEAAVYLDRAHRNSRVLAWRAGVLLGDAEPAPTELAEAVATLATSARELRRALASEREPVRARELALDAARLTIGLTTDGVLGFSGNVVVAQIRAAAGDLLRAAGVPDGIRQIRQLTARPAPPT
jgi:uncharacterized membrane protein YgaE (UPF0421/DUF939 family)